MESPVIVDNCVNYSIPVDAKETGFPFDDSDYDTNTHLQSTLQNIAQRHPEFADQLNFDHFPTWRRKRYGSGSSTDRDDARPHTPGSSRSFDTPDSRRFADHSFPSGFNRFPFTSHFDDLTDDFRTEEKPPEIPRPHEKRGRKVNPNLPQHLSNTVDLGQKQTPVEENRGQRSMSAPPDNRATHGNTSKVESEPPKDMGSMFTRQNRGTQDPRSQNTQQTQTKPKERVIPIHVEGRDEPLMPKNINIEPQKVFSEPNHIHQQHVHPQMASTRQQNTPYQQHSTPSYQQPHFMKQPAQPPQHNVNITREAPAPQPETQEQVHQHHQEQPQFQPQPPPANLNDPLEKIKSVKADVLDLMVQVEKFQGTRKDKHYIYLDEMLTRNLLKLDNIETEGKDNIRLARREAIKCIQECINKLEAKAQACEQHEMAKSPEVQTNVPAKASSEMIVAEQQQAAETKKPPVFKSEAKIQIKAPEIKPEETDIQNVTQPSDKAAEVSDKSVSQQNTENQITTAVLVPNPAKENTQPTSEQTTTEPMEVDSQSAESKSQQSAATSAADSKTEVSNPNTSQENAEKTSETQPATNTTNPSHSADETNM